MGRQEILHKLKKLNKTKKKGVKRKAKRMQWINILKHFERLFFL